jgi:hypothetical protein
MTTIDTGAESGSPTDTQGDSRSADSPAAHDPSADFGPDALRATLERKEAEKQTDKQPGKKPAKASEAGKKTADSVDTTDGKADPKAKGESEETIPITAFKARLGKETEKRRAAEERASTQANEIERLRAAVELASEEIQRLQQARKDGVTYDEKDELLRNHEVSAEARARLEKLQRKHEEDVRRAREEGEVEAYKENLAEEIGRALQSHDLVDQKTLIAEMSADLSLSAAEAAERIETRLLERAKARLAATAPPKKRFPTTASASASGDAIRRHELSAQGLAARLEELNAQNR